MSKEQDLLIAQANKLRLQVADAEAAIGHLKAKLARVDAKLSGDPTPETGLDQLWQLALPTSRTRSSKIQCRTEWNRIPKHERPTVPIALDALRAWNRCEEWKKDGNAYAPGLHRWIKARQWENLPETSRHDPHARYQPTPTPPPAARTAEDEAALLAFLSRPRKLMPS